MLKFFESGENVLTAAAFVGLLFFALREALKASLKRDVDRYVELLKHDLQREALKAELTTKQNHFIYPRLMRKLRRAQGAFGELIGSFGPGWQGLDDEELAALLQKMRVPGKQRKALLEKLRNGDPSATPELEKVIWNHKISRAYQLAVQAKNYTILNALFLSEPVHSAALAIANKMAVSAFGTFHNMNPTDLDKTKTAAETELPLLEEQMRADLRPQTKQGKGIS